MREDELQKRSGVLRDGTKNLAISATATDGLVDE